MIDTGSTADSSVADELINASSDIVQLTDALRTAARTGVSTRFVEAQIVKKLGSATHLCHSIMQRHTAGQPLSDRTLVAVAKTLDAAFMGMNALAVHAPDRVLPGDRPH